MKYFPAFLKIADHPCLVVGGGSLALKKAELLLRAGAVVDVLAEEISPAMRDRLGEAQASGQVRFLSATFMPSMLTSYQLIVSASGHTALDEAVALAAQALGKPVNVVDRTDLCSFIMPSIVDRGDVVIGISTSGTSPVLARRLRAQIESVLPARLRDLAAFAGAFRDAVKERFSFPERRQFWERFFESDIAHDVLAGNMDATASDMDVLIAQGLPPEQRGHVSIVGTGPGDPDLLTLKALRVMQAADVVLYDKLIGPEILDYARRDADFIYVGKSRANHHKSQDEINALMVHHACSGRHVVRLKGGDPFVFGRGGEEQAYLNSHGISVDVVAGVSAAIGCAASTHIPLTHREVANAVTFVTGHGKDGAEPDLNWAALAQLNQTLVVYMGLNTADHISARLIDNGLRPTTPVAVIENGTRDNQRIVKGALNELGPLIAKNSLSGPALLIIGEVVQAADADYLLALTDQDERHIA